MSLSTVASRLAKFAIDNSPTILTSIGVVGAVTTAYLAGKASFEASDLIRLKEADDEQRGVLPLDRKELLKDRVDLVWRLYIPTATTCAATIICIIGANRVGARRAAALAAGYSILEKAGEEYRAKVAEKFGERKEEQVRDEINQDRVTKSYSSDMKLLGLADGELCYDKFSDRFFLGSVESIQAAVNVLNNDMNHNGYATLGDFYRLLEIEVPAFAESIGWNTDRLLEVRCGSTLAHDRLPAIVMEFRHDPRPDYGRFRH
jgi:hypothetical protein